MGALYNENEPYAAQWLESLTKAGHIAPGCVDGRDIRLLGPSDISSATQFHAFAGIGAWSYSLRLAGWPDDTPVWTGSCPCQPFSGAGRRKGTKDARHLWPEWHRLIAECLPTIVLGEQVAGPAGRDWLAVVRDEMEELGYEVGAADLCAAGAGAPHIRQRLFFGAIRVVDAENRQRRNREPEARAETQEPSRGRGAFDRVGDTNVNGSWRHGRAVSRKKREGKGQRSETRSFAHELESASNTGGRLADAIGSRLKTRPVVQPWEPHVAGGRQAGEPWKRAEWVACRDGKARPIEPGTFPLSYGPPSRVERLRSGEEKEIEQSRAGMIRGYGNAIVPQIAAIFIRSFIDAYLDSSNASE